VGNPDFNSEKLIAYEAGYRARPRSRLTTDLATFINAYDDVRSVELGVGPPIGRINLLNNMNARSYGVEVSITYDVLESLRLYTGYSYLHKHLFTDADHIDVFRGTLEGDDARNKFFIRETANLPHRLQFDSTLRFVDKLPDPFVPHYVELDARFGWTPKGSMDFSIVGQNLLDAQHPEFNAASPTRAEVLRNIYGRVTVRF
jgi:iron complex outermembrane receptor protein